MGEGTRCRPVLLRRVGGRFSTAGRHGVTGRLLYNNQSEVVREALRLLAEQDRLREAHLERLRTALAAGLKEADRGELLDGPEVVGEMREFLRQRGKSGERG